MKSLLLRSKLWDSLYLVFSLGINKSLLISQPPFCERNNLFLPRYLRLLYLRLIVSGATAYIICVGSLYWTSFMHVFSASLFTSEFQDTQRAMPFSSSCADLIYCTCPSSRLFWVRERSLFFVLHAQPSHNNSSLLSLPFCSNSLTAT